MTFQCMETWHLTITVANFMSICIEGMFEKGKEYWLATKPGSIYRPITHKLTKKKEKNL